MTTPYVYVLDQINPEPDYSAYSQALFLSNAASAGLAVAINETILVGGILTVYMASALTAGEYIVLSSVVESYPAAPPLLKKNEEEKAAQSSEEEPLPPSPKKAKGWIPFY